MTLSLNANKKIERKTDSKKERKKERNQRESDDMSFPQQQTEGGTEALEHRSATPASH